MKPIPYNDIFKNLLLHKVDIKCNNKIIRSGVIKNFAFKQFIIKVFIETNKGTTRVLEIPYPFSITSVNNTITLDYKLHTFCQNNSELLYKIKLLNKKHVSKFYDNTIDIILN